MLDAEFYRKQCARLREESEELLETVRQLRVERDTLQRLCNTPIRQAMETLKVSPGAAKVLCRLIDAAPKALTAEVLLTHIGGVNSDCIKVYISRVRSKLRSMGCTAKIRNVYRIGYYLSEADAHEVRMLLDEKNEGDVNLSATLNLQTSAQEKQRAAG